MFKLSNGLGLTLKAQQDFFADTVCRQNLDGDNAFCIFISGLVDGAHTALAKRAHQFKLFGELNRRLLIGICRPLRLIGGLILLRLLIGLLHVETSRVSGLSFTA